MTIPTQRRYVLDTNVLMTAHHDYYSPGLCPGFWDCLSHYIALDRLFIIDHVCDEIVYPTELVNWVNRVTNDSSVATGTQPVADAYRQLIDWVQDNPQFTAAARAEFASVADGWIAAYAMANGAVVVTNEVSAPQSQNAIKIPDLCRQFDIPCINTFAMLRELGAQFEWRQTG